MNHSAKASADRDSAIIEMYLGGQSMASIAQQIAISASAVSNILARHMVPKRSRYEVASLREFKEGSLSKKALRIIEGQMLGDGFIGMSVHQAFFRLHTADEGFAGWLLSELEKEGVPISPCGKVAKSIRFCKNGKKQVSYSVRTISTLQFARLHKEWYFEGKKRIPKRLNLTSEHLLHWWVGDGSVRNGCSAMFCTDCFTYDEHLFLADQLARNFDIHAVIRPEKNKYFRLFVPSQACELIRTVGSPPFPSVAHKWCVRPAGKRPMKIDIDPSMLRKLYLDQDKSATEIAEFFGCCRGTIYEHAKLLGLRKDARKRPRWSISDKEASAIAERYRRGASIVETAKEFGVNRSTVRRAILKYAPEAYAVRKRKKEL
jgi:transposase-like protein